MVKKAAPVAVKPKVEVKKEAKEVKPKVTPSVVPASKPAEKKVVKQEPQKTSPLPQPEKNEAKIELKIGNWGEKAKSPAISTEDRLISIQPKDDEKPPEPKKRKLSPGAESKKTVKFERATFEGERTTSSPATTPRQVEEPISPAESQEPEKKTPEKKDEKKVIVEHVIVEQREIRDRSGSKTRLLLLSPVNGNIRKR